jgi:hypothetical protein
MKTSGVKARQHDTVLYNSIFRGDDEMAAQPASPRDCRGVCPDLHLCRREQGGMFATYADSVARIWRAQHRDRPEGRTILRRDRNQTQQCRETKSP